MDARTLKTFEELNARLSRLDYLATETVATAESFDQDEFKELFITNKPPSDGQRRKLQQSVKSKEKELSDIFWESYELKKKLDALDSRQASLRESIRPLKNVLSPFRQLPEDIIREILLACLDMDNAPTMSNKSVPMVLTQISSGLRRIALSTAALWAAIHISIIGCKHEDYLGQAKEIMNRREDGIATWLSRSANYPLSISVHALLPYNAITYLGKGVLDILMDHRSRWQKIDFKCPPEFLTPIISLNSTEVPLLQSAAFEDSNCFGYLRSRMDGPLDSWPKIMLLNGLHLTKLTIRGSGAHKALHYPKVRFAGLTHLVLLTISKTEVGNQGALINAAPRHLVAILRQTYRLVSLTTDIFIDRSAAGNAYVAASDLSLPYLKTLSLKHPPMTYQGDIDNGLLKIHAPLLEAFEYPRFSTLLHSVTSFLERSAHLRELRISEATHDTLIPFLRFCPMLTTLHINLFKSGILGNKKDELILSALITEDNRDSVCPQLVYFYVQNSPMIVSPQLLGSFLRGKKGVCVHLMVIRGEESLYDIVEKEACERDPKLKLTLPRRVAPWISTDLGRDCVLGQHDGTALWGWPTSFSVN